MLTHGRFLLTDPQLSGIDDIARYFEGNGFRILKELVQNWPIRRSCEEVLMQHLTYMRSTFLINSSLNLLLSTNSHVAMGKFYESISDDLRDWALRQSVFFVASAPLRGRHVNLSPKGLPDSCLAFFGPNQVAYIDSTGSGCETISHVRENGRITLMFCSFETSPRILRLFSTGTVIEWDQPEFDVCVQRMGKTPIAGARAIIQLDVFKVQTSCGYGVPLLTLTDDPETEPSPYLKDRQTLGHFAAKTVSAGQIHKYQQEWNSRSLDGLPGLRSALKASGHYIWRVELENWFSRHWYEVDILKSLALVLFVFVGVMALRWGK
ncbi:hypothetical protein EN45_090130 [Penicillium chrysogenum]|uniref:Pyridoxamine 5'-phosphate oxidase putative domain-containing protein n=1 Tax=Penicillium chrysogenum TaxID=5076 RepID=A0A162C0T7_PENCH|nr:hypothetical protein EN45_090130 [Penicillium chrysogenum]